ncbi:redoxin domain-containing protein [Microbulbifer hainanensis]|uniref:redoxin domain-containing protein n=1 Tax=Microbulbifer hainanensis TaxID=2735675 RepID=UPI00186731E1|nr:redoxin domain-containing protein [Microbulbifer hainanensis]
MKNLNMHILRRVLSVVLLLPTIAVAANIPDSLQQIPFPLISGDSVKLADYRGDKPVYVKFWASWCKPCMKEMPHFEHVQEEYGDTIQVISVNLGINDDLESVRTTMKQFGLTMPTAIDKSGCLAEAFHFIGTPYHLLFDRNMNLVHVGHKASAELDNKIALLSRTKPLDMQDSAVLDDGAADLQLSLDDGKLHGLLFTASWCDWYLQDTRPQVSRACARAPRELARLRNKYPQVEWRTVLSRLWTTDKDLQAYRKKYAVSGALDIDASNRLFMHYGVRNYPTLVLIRDGKELYRTSDLANVEIPAQLAQQSH